MKKEVKTYKDMTVVREEKIICGADWREHPEGEKVIITTVTRHHKNPDFEEVLLKDDPLFKEAVEATI